MNEQKINELNLYLSNIFNIFNDDKVKPVTAKGIISFSLHKLIYLYV